VLTHDQRRELIEKIRVFPAQLRARIAGLTDEQLTTHFLEGEWTVAQNVHHVVDSHMNSYVRCKLIATEDRPALRAYDQDRWAELPDASDADVSASLALLANLHMRWVRFWERLPDDAWQRAGMHPENGAMTLDDILQTYADHGRAHIDQIQRTLAAQP
jgi:hypothetical protein